MRIGAIGYGFIGHIQQIHIAILRIKKMKMEIKFQKWELTNLTVRMDRMQMLKIGISHLLCSKKCSFLTLVEIQSRLKLWKNILYNA